MISRIAEQSYWMCRYLERGESIARMLLATYQFSLDNKFYLSKDKHPLLLLSNEEADFYGLYPDKTGNEGQDDNELIQDFIVWEESNPSSLINTFKNMRENARSISEILPNDLWQTVNNLYLFMNEDYVKRLIVNKRQDFYKLVLDYCWLIKGVFNNFILRDDYYQMMEIGLMLERALQTVNIVEEMIKDWLSQSLIQPSERKVKYFGLLLECCASTDAYLKCARNFEPSSILDYFFCQTAAPYSMQFCLQTCQSNLSKVFTQSKTHKRSQAQKHIEELIGRIGAINRRNISLKGITAEKNQIFAALDTINDSLLVDIKG